jgi:hypothetical protein
MSLAYDHVQFLRSGGLARAGGSEIDRKMKLCPQIMSPQNVRFRRRAGMLAADGLRDWAASLHPQRHSAAEAPLPGSGEGQSRPRAAENLSG